MKLFKKNKKQKVTIPKLSYCIVIPFAEEIDYKNAIKSIAETRGKQIDGKNKWYLDGMLIDKEDYERLLEKSKSIEIVNELEEEYDDVEVEDITW